MFIRVCVKEPKGGFYLFPDFEPFRVALLSKGISNSLHLCKSILNETGVAILPGSAFLKEENSLTARLAFVNFDGQEALSQFEKNNLSVNEPVNESFLRNACPNTVKGTERLSNWVSLLN